MSAGKKGEFNVANICFDCRKALGGCSWSRDFIPVPGWTAEPAVLKCGGSESTQTYRITACPLFDPDGKTPTSPDSIPIRCIETGVVFRSLNAAAKAAGGSIGALRDMIHKGRSYAYGYHWELVGKETTPC